MTLVNPRMFTGEDISRFGYKANIAGVATALAFMASVLPYSYVADCRANYSSANVISTIRLALMLYTLGVFLASYYRVLYYVAHIGYAVALTIKLLYRVMRYFFHRQINFFEAEKCVKSIGRNILKFATRDRLHKWPRLSKSLGFIGNAINGIPRDTVPFFLGSLSLLAFFYSTYLISPLTFDSLTWNSVIENQRDATIQCSILQQLPMNKDFTNPYTQVSPIPDTAPSSN